jgi:cytochrome P450
MPRSSGGTIEHDLHITRKKPLLKHFSMRSIREMEDRIRPSVDKFFCLLQQAEKSGTVFNLNTGFMALASDVISEYCYGFPLGYLDDPELKNSVRETLGTLLSFGHLLGYIPNALAIYNMLPKAFTTRFLSKVEELFETNDSVRARCVQALKQRNFSKPTIIESLEHESIPENERTPDRIGDECLLLLFAGTETSARVLSTIMYHLLSNLAIFSRLREEVIRVMPTPSHYPTLSDLESLPYLVRGQSLYCLMF